jgi:proline dehydrogenase
MFELIRSYTIFSLCTVRPLVSNADKVLSLSKQVFGGTVVDAVVKQTFFKHFCGGETVDDLRPCIKLLNENGINGILDYAAENAPDDAIVTSPEDQNIEINQPARTYDYFSEEQCDHHVEIFKTCIRAVKEVTPHGFAALKITALGNPLLLERMSTAIVESARLFDRFDKSGDGLVTVVNFEQVYREVFTDAEEVREEKKRESKRRQKPQFLRQLIRHPLRSQNSPCVPPLCRGFRTSSQGSMPMETD